jgi:hypothetical protein
VDTPATPTTPLPSPCPCGGDRLLYREAGLPPILVCIDCHDWQFAPQPVED